MNTSMKKSVITKPLTIDFDLHTDGDEEFKKELIILMIDNIRELQEALSKAIMKSNIQIFRETSHKVKPTISIVNDKDLTDMIDELKLQPEETRTTETVLFFNRRCEDIIKDLEEEIR